MIFRESSGDGEPGEPLALDLMRFWIKWSNHPKKAQNLKKNGGKIPEDSETPTAQLLSFSFLASLWLIGWHSSSPSQPGRHLEALEHQLWQSMGGGWWEIARVAWCYLLSWLLVGFLTSPTFFWMCSRNLRWQQSNAQPAHVESI